jgi:stage II sporulation protein D
MHETRRPRHASGLRRFRARGATLLACALAIAVPASSADAATWKVKGRGWGHGIGMSQWGAFGFAEKGKGWEQILRHYYRHTQIGTTGGGEIRVLLQSGGDSFEFTEANRACGVDLDPSRTYSAVRDGGGVRLRGGDGQGLGGCGESLQATGGEAVRLVGKGAYRGSLNVVPRESGGLHAINAVHLEDYLRGVVPNEMPADWPADALRAQAVAARSYALATADSNGLWDAYDDTRSQVYGGISSEMAATNQAVEATAGRVVKHNGKVATTFFFSTSGGRTENIEFSFVGSDPQAYLKSVKDPFDDASPYHRWKESFSQSEIEARLGDLVEGSLRAIRIGKRGRSPRVVSAKIVGSGGTNEASGPMIQARLGLRSTWFSFKKRR